MACDESVFSGTDNWGDQIRCLRKEIEGLKNDIKGASRETAKFSAKLGDSFNIARDLGKTINSLKNDMVDFTKSAQRQYDLAEKIAQSYKQASISIGLSVGRSKQFNSSFKASVAEIARFGGSIQDAEGIYTEFAENSGRVRILGEDEVTNIFKLGKATNLMGTEAATLYETLDLMGVGNENATDRMEEVIKSSQSIGLNSSKVMKTLANNMNKMQGYSFAGGVRGMTEMAKKAVQMRVDVSDVLGMADKFYQPEAAIEAAANLQMLGGDIAKAFGDPFETMYLARNKPEELADKLKDMTENMLVLNKKTGEYELPAESRMQLKAAGDQLGINVDTMIEMTRQTNKMRDVKNQLKGVSSFSDKEMDGIANLARMEDGEYKVDFFDESGNKMSKSIDELTNADLEMALSAPQNEEDYMTKMIDNSMTTNELLEAINDNFQKQFVRGTNIYSMTEGASTDTLTSLRELTSKSVKDMRDAMFSDDGPLMRLNDVPTAMENIDKRMAEAIDGMTDLSSTSIEVDNNGRLTIKNNVTNVNETDGTPDPIRNTDFNETEENPDDATALITPNEQILDFNLNFSFDGITDPNFLAQLDDPIVKDKFLKMVTKIFETGEWGLNSDGKIYRTIT